MRQLAARCTARANSSGRAPREPPATVKLLLEPPSTYFVHVPKTGGLSLAAFLEGRFRPSETVTIMPPTMREMEVADLRGFRLYHSMHQGRTLLEMTGRHDLACITMVRDPVERSVSQILYLQRVVAREPETFTPEYLDAVRPVLDADLGERIDDTAFALACDRQIRTLGIREDYTPFFKGSPDAASGRSVLRPYDPPPLMDVGDADRLLANARSWLREMAVVGIQERYRDSVLLVCDALGLAAPKVLPRRNVNPGKGDVERRYRDRLSPRVVAQLEELTEHDRRLYAFARELFDEQWAAFLARPKRIYSIGPRLRLAAGAARDVLHRAGRLVRGRSA